MDVLFLLCSAATMLLSGVLAATNDPNYSTGLYDTRDMPETKIIDVAIVRDLIKEEVANSWSKIVSDLQDQLVSQERRIQFLETRDRRRQTLIDELALKVRGHERNVYCQDVNIEKDAEYVAEQEHVQQNQENDFDYTNTRINQSGRSASKRGVSQINRIERNVLSGAIRRQTNHQNVAFTAYLDHPIMKINAGQTVKMDKVLLNDGNGYNVYTGVFTVPVSGVYMFSFFVETPNQSADVKLKVDGVGKVDIVVMPTDGVASTAGNIAILRAKAGQSVWLEHTFDNGFLHSYSGGRYCTFSGVLLY